MARIKTASGEEFVIYRLGDTLKQIEEEITLLALENNSGVISLAAKAIGLKRTTLSERLRQKIRRTNGIPAQPE